MTMATTKKALDKAERAKLAELRATVKELPISELAKLRREGLHGQPLFKALGFGSDAEESAWLQGSESRAPVRAKKPDSKLKPQRSRGGDPWLNEAPAFDTEVPSARQLIDDSEKSLGARLKKNASEAGTKAKRLRDDSPQEEQVATKREEAKRSRTSKPEEDVNPGADDTDASESDEENEERKVNKKSQKRKAPLERSSKHQVSRNRQVIQVPGFLRRGDDPRFSKQDVDLNLHRARYGFLEDVRNEEIEEKHRVLQRELLARQLKGTRRGRRLKRLTDDELSAMRSELTRLEQHKAETERAKKVAARVTDLKRENASKKGFFIAKTTRKEIEQEVKMEDYKRRHKMERFEKREEHKRVRKESKDKGPQLGL